jgi:tol-pal system protein YbgF
MKLGQSAKFSCLGLVVLLSSWATMAAGLDTDQRLELLERRANKITDLTVQLNALERDNDQLRGQIETLAHQIAQLERKQRDRYLDLSERLDAQARMSTAKPPRISVVSAVPSAQPTELEATTPKTGSTVKAESLAEQAYVDALALVRSQEQRNYTQAITAFRAFLKKYPQHKKAANAYYWLGSVYFALPDYTAALKAFTQVVERYPDSVKVPDAWYMMARVRYAQGDALMARRLWQRVINTYPQSAVAVSAKKKLLETSKKNKEKTRDP